MAKKPDRKLISKIVNEQAGSDYYQDDQGRTFQLKEPFSMDRWNKLFEFDKNLPIKDYKPVDWSAFNFVSKDVDWSSPVGQKLIFSPGESDWFELPEVFANLIGAVKPEMFELDVAEGKELEVASFRMDLVEVEKPQRRIILLDEVGRLQRCIEDIYYDNSTLFRISPREFEEVSAELLRGQGFDVELTKQTRDGGFDLLALKTLGDIPLRFLVECKRFAPERPVSVKMIRELCSVIQTSNANKGLLLTTSYFSKDAKEYRNKFMPYLLDLRDHGDLLSWVKDYLHS